MAKRLTPLKAIREFCKDCVGGAHWVNDCGGDNNCVLFPFRKGHNPARKGMGRKDAFKPKEANESGR
ncbi:hypothetical protein LCGC14_1934240 [marine sediment metagenome]|uniref:Uncharacterized protein n=1 Tax=marine sediment metagenome TaxID=412755 RepID=A0A0F9GAI8_9ZZZZ